jgi:hypothetical protein
MSVNNNYTDINSDDDSMNASKNDTDNDTIDDIHDNNIDNIDDDDDEDEIPFVQIIETTERSEKYICNICDGPIYIIIQSDYYNFINNKHDKRAPQFGIQQYIRMSYSLDNITYNIFGLIYQNFLCDEDEMTYVESDMLEKLIMIVGYIQEMFNKYDLCHYNTSNYYKERQCFIKIEQIN